MGFCDDFHFFGYHEGRIESQTKVSDDGIGIIFIFFKEVVSAWKSYLIDIFVDLFGCKSDTPVGNGDGIFS